MRKVLTFLIGFIPINIIKIFLLRIVGHSISYKSYIGFSVLLVSKMEIQNNARIKHFNILKFDKLFMEYDSFIGNFNLINGPLEIYLKSEAGISKQNKIRRAYAPISYKKSALFLGKNSIVVSNHFLDLTRSIYIGDNSIVAGINSQFWTHGYYHANKGPDRIRIDGEVRIGDNVYVGSGCIFNPGVTVGNAIHIGTGSVISKDLKESGMYVGQALRFIDNNLDLIKSKLNKVEEDGLVEIVYTKK
jgi:acetyltransferase-like isoleucine patch superfamily enzyme